MIGSTPAIASPGVFFEHVTHLLNMRELEDEGKVMALADYASPVADRDNPLFSVLTARDLSFVTARPGRSLTAPLRQVLWRYPNEQFAYMAQRALEEACVKLVGHALDRTGERRIALAGGVASNIKVNRRLRLMPGVEESSSFPTWATAGCRSAPPPWRRQSWLTRPTCGSTGSTSGRRTTTRAIETALARQRTTVSTSSRHAVNGR